MATPILDVARRLGANLRRISTTEFAGPCPRCGGRDRFSINVTRGVFNCRGCGVGGDDIALVRHLLGCGFREAAEFVGRADVLFDKAIAGEHGGAHNPYGRAGNPGRFVKMTSEEAAENVGWFNPETGEFIKFDNVQLDKDGSDAPTGNSKDAGLRRLRKAAEAGDDRIKPALDLWNASDDPRRSPVETYFASRGLTLDDDLAGDVLRWNPRIGAMIALFRNIVSGEPQAVSRTFLDGNAQKLERRFLGPVGGAAIMLDGFDAVSHGLHIAEGLESGQAARQLGLRPAWALGSAGAVASFPILGGVECLTLLAEHDEASARAVEASAARWHGAGREVLINRPRRGKDLNDAIRGDAA